MKRVLITGVKGMAGSHLADLMARDPLTYVVGIDLPHPPMDVLVDAEVTKVGMPGRFEYTDCDIRSWADLSRVFTEFRPEVVFHLAALAFVPDSWEDPYEYLETNVAGTVHVLECAKDAVVPPIVQVACSSEEYGKVYMEDLPIRTSQPFRPLSPYGVTKVAAELYARQYWESYGILTVPTRTFNHTGPRQHREYVTSEFCAQAVEIRRGIREKFQHGDLTSVRDFTDVRDIVVGYAMAVEWAEMARAGGMVHQIGGGAVLSIEHLLRLVCREAGLEFTSEVDPKRFRPSDVKLLQCDSTDFRMRTGWAPTIPLAQTVRDTLQYWDDKL